MPPRQLPSPAPLSASLARPATIAALGAVLLLSAAGCGPSCAELAQRYATALRPPEAAPPQGWHLALALPWQLVNSQLQTYVPRDLPLALPLASGPGSAPPLRLRLEALVIGPAAQDQLELKAKLAVLAGSERAFSLTLIAALEPALKREQRAVELGLKPAALREARVQLAPGAAEGLADALYRQLPRGAQRVVSPQLARVMARGVIEQLASRLTFLLAERYGEQLASLAKLRLRLPHAPLQRLSLRSLPGKQGGLLVLARAELPLPGVAEPAQLLSSRRIAQAGARGSLLLALQPQAAVGLLTRARAEGQLPGRFNYAGKPDPAGELEVTFGWQPDSYPLKITVWSLGGGRCAAVTFGLRPRVTSQQDTLVLRLDDRRREATVGRPLGLAALWFHSLGQQASERQQRLARGLTLSLGRAEQHLRPIAASVERERLLLELQPAQAVGTPPAPIPAPRSGS